MKTVKIFISFTLFSIFMTSSAFAYTGECLFGGWPSQRNSKGQCVVPWALSKPVLKDDVYGPACGKEKFRCNPSIFGPGEKGQGICIKVRADFRYLSYDCLKESTRLNKKNGHWFKKQSTDEFLKLYSKVKNYDKFVNSYCEKRNGRGLCKYYKKFLKKVHEQKKAIDKFVKKPTKSETKIPQNPAPEVIISTGPEVKNPEPEIIISTGPEVKNPEPEIIISTEPDVENTEPEIIISTEPEVENPEPEIIISTEPEAVDGGRVPTNSKTDSEVISTFANPVASLLNTCHSIYNNAQNSSLCVEAEVFAKSLKETRYNRLDELKKSCEKFTKVRSEVSLSSKVKVQAIRLKLNCRKWFKTEVISSRVRTNSLHNPYKGRKIDLSRYKIFKPGFRYHHIQYFSAGFELINNPAEVDQKKFFIGVCKEVIEPLLVKRNFLTKRIEFCTLDNDTDCGIQRNTWPEVKFKISKQIYTIEEAKIELLNLCEAHERKASEVIFK